MNWLSLITTAIGIIASVIDYLKSRQQIDGALAEVLLKNLQGSLDEIQKAQKARDSVPTDPGRLRDDDGFRRSD